MNSIKGIFSKITGYWLHKKRYLPIGFSLEFDVKDKIKYGKIEVIFDIGANIGQSYIYFRNIFSEAKIYSFEPLILPLKN